MTPLRRFQIETIIYDMKMKKKNVENLTKPAWWILDCNIYHKTNTLDNSVPASNIYCYENFFLLYTLELCDQKSYNLKNFNLYFKIAVSSN